LLPDVSKSLWTPPLPVETKGEAVMFRPRLLLLHWSTVVLPCAASSLKEPGLVADSQIERVSPLTLPR
jgi:hypothetical protein